MKSNLLVSVCKDRLTGNEEGNITGRKSGEDLFVIIFSPTMVVLTITLLFFLMSSCKKGEVATEETIPEKWVTMLPSEIYYSSPALSRDEKSVYIGTSTGLFGNHNKSQFFVAMDVATGTERWRLPLGTGEVRSTPVVAHDNTISFAVETRDPVNNFITGDELWHVSASGNLLWSYDINPRGLTIDVGHSSPATGPDGTIYIAGDSLYALTPEGSRRWTAFGNTSEALRNAPVIGADGTVYFVYHNMPLTALNPDDGSVIWSCPLGVNDHCFASPAIDADGNIYVATEPGILYAVSPAGQLLWTFDLASVGFNGIFRSSPAIDENGAVFFGINTGNPTSAFFALNSDGTLKWKFEPSDMPDDVPNDHFDIYSSPAIGSDNIVYFGQEFGHVYALRTSDGSLAGMTNTESGITWSSPAIDSKGVLYISDMSGRVYALQTGSMGLSTSAAWPKFRFDNQNSGRIP